MAWRKGHGPAVVAPDSRVPVSWLLTEPEPLCRQGATPEQRQTWRLIRAELNEMSMGHPERDLRCCLGLDAAAVRVWVIRRDTWIRQRLANDPRVVED
jgi:hypothetical protein